MLIDVHRTDERGNIFTLRENLTVEGITVPAGFSSDGASVPRFFWRLVFPPGDQKALKAAFVHDWLYRTHPDGWLREAADNLFLKLLIEEGMPKYRAVLAWIGVRLFGGAAWKAGGADSANFTERTEGAGTEVNERKPRRCCWPGGFCDPSDPSDPSDKSEEDANHE